MSNRVIHRPSRPTGLWAVEAALHILRRKNRVAAAGLLAPLVLGAVILPGIAGETTTAAASTSGQPASGQPAFDNADGIHVVATRKIDDRQYNVQVLSSALGQVVDVRVLLPTGYTQHPNVRYPVLYLFHGTSGRASDWFDTSTALGPSKWETFHIGQLVPWVDASLRTVAKRDGRAIAGLSQGGFGSMSYAARHPDMFEAAAAFSGAPDIDRDPALIPPATALIEYTATVLDGVEPDAMFGPRATNEINWQGHDPATLSTNLRGMGLSLFTGEGKPGPFDPPTPSPAAIAIEKLTYASTSAFHSHLVAEQIPSYYNDYVYGTHTFPYWARDLREYIAPLMESFAHPTAPKSISFTSIDPSWSQWGWSVSLHRPARAFSTLTNAGQRGFGLRGTGTAAITTPAAYKPSSPATVSVVGFSGTKTLRLRADRSGRLHVSVPLSASLIAGSVAVTIRGVSPG